VETALYLLAALLVLAGLAGTVLPVLPGPPLVFAGLVIAAWVNHFERVGAVPIVICGILAAASIGVDVAATALGARKVGASPLALAGSVAGGIVGLFFGLPGLLLGPFAGAAIGEAIAVRDLYQAGKAGLGTWLGIVVGSVVKLVLCLVMLAVFAIAWFV
jgi:uncharacterized protein YqgC (DUF456 family)